MSSSYSYAEMEAARKAALRQQLRQELAAGIQKLREQLQTGHANRVHMVSGSNMKTTVSLGDDTVKKSTDNITVTGAVLQKEEGSSSIVRAELDFSDLLNSVQHRPTKLEQELDFWTKKAEERPVITEKDENDRVRLLAEITKAVQSSADIEDKVRAVRMRVSAYLQGAARLTDADREKMENDYLKYCALCEMLEIHPVEYLPSRIEKEIARMTQVLEKRRQDEYVMEVIEEIMEELGCHVRDDAVLDSVDGQIYAVDGHPLCDVFVGNDGSGIMFEPVGESRGGSADRQRQTEISAEHICAVYAELEERAAEKGVLLNRVYMEPVHMEEMCVKSDVTAATGKKRKAASQKQRALDSEG